MARRFASFIGIDLGGARGKTTALARLTADPERLEQGVTVAEVGTRCRDGRAWYDAVLIETLSAQPEHTVVAIDAPLTLPACIRCQQPVCPGQERCVDPAVVWLNTVGTELCEATAALDHDRIAAVPAHGGIAKTALAAAPSPRPHLSPYTHRGTSVVLRHRRGITTPETLGQGTGAITARAAHLRRALAAHGYRLNDNLIEVSPRATVQALFGERRARGYKRDADPWQTRAAIVEALAETLDFAPSSRLSREEVLRNDHCFDAVLSAYTAYLWARDDWQLPVAAADVFQVDGWIWVPEDRAPS
jgi:predicted nuclease with RNAse H fold